jgi:lathosterol oxidase
MTFSHFLQDAALHAPLGLVAGATIAWFALIYAAIAGGAWLFAVDRSRSGPMLRPGQVRRELLLSSLSILVFALQSVALVACVREGWLAIAWDRPFWSLAWELPLLYLWNELHFFAVHRALHWRPAYRAVHAWHHRSLATTPFSAYSFHPAESFLLGTVMPLALLMFAWSPAALLGLTVMSLMLNVAGHVAHDTMRPAFAFIQGQSRHHNRHHREFRVHYGFSLPLLDRWWGGK